MPKAFPLDTQASKTKDELLQGYAWYFYHAATNEFLIDYSVPAKMLTNYITETISHLNIPFQIVGYSQGGYLAPFLAELLYKGSLSPELVIGLNCSIRVDLLKEVPKYPLHQLQGREDNIIDTELAYTRFEELKEQGLKVGDFHWVKGVDHYLKSELAEECIKISTSPQSLQSSN